MSIVLLSEKYMGTDPTGYYMSEKLDGIRALWTGQDLMSRNGNVFSAPQWFKDILPKSKLDGELFLGRGRFKEASSIIRSGSMDKGWKNISFMTFDIPDPKAGKVETRWEKLQAIVKEVNHPQLQYLQQIKCTGYSQLMMLLDAVIKLGAEGLMLRKPGSFYETKKSTTLLKVKRTEDAEAKVMEYITLVSGGNEVPGMMGALRCVLPNGVIFKVGSGFDDAQRRNPPAIGATITFKYQELDSVSGKPRFPIYVGVRDYE